MIVATTVMSARSLAEIHPSGCDERHNPAASKGGVVTDPATSSGTTAAPCIRPPADMRRTSGACIGARRSWS